MGPCPTPHSPEWVWLGHNTSFELLWGKSMGKTWGPASSSHPYSSVSSEVEAELPGSLPKEPVLTPPLLGDRVSTCSPSPVLSFPGFMAILAPDILPG